MPTAQEQPAVLPVCEHRLIPSVPVTVRESVLPSVARDLAQSIMDDLYFNFSN